MRTVGQKINKNKKKEPNCLEGLTFSENCLGNVFSSVGPVSKAAVVKSREEEKRDEGSNTQTQKEKKSCRSRILMEGVKHTLLLTRTCTLIQQCAP